MPARQETELNEDINDAFYFLMIAAHRAAVLVDVLTERHGYELPRLRQAKLIQQWRDTQEHWDDPAGQGKGARVLRKWAALDSRTTPLDDPASRGLDLDGLRRDLDDILTALLDHIETDTGTRPPE
jgi:hypothetical protein